MVRGLNDQRNVQNLETVNQEELRDEFLHEGLEVLPSSYHRHRLRCLRDTVILNVGGTIHQVRWETLEKFPKSRLHSLRYAVTEGCKQ